ncbi:rhodanese-like domain-containing protein [Bowmanella pacifica]|uniref:Rhodanese domain-containing protein n=1 Tax=Bowmanella pacifica TaxID=502051 RepID=A0A918DKF2_9ALTE|nr:rhodanese-like domain-containing protein [Bowmanella pacifica]GGO69075.1 hypothetical protein GCM10010982_19500 [Bowmanella pacifica]
MRLYILLLVLFTSLASASGTGFSSISAQQLLERKQDVVVVDVRTPEEYAEGHVPGAINVPHDRINEFLQQLDNEKSSQLVLYCRSGRRAKLAANELHKLGFGSITLLEGDMLGWQEQGLQVEK